MNIIYFYLFVKDFPEPKQSGNYMIPTLGIDEGTFIFTHLSLFLSYITPHDLPVGKFKNLEIFSLYQIEIN